MSDLDLLRDIEAAAVRGWPTLKTQDVDGWIWRYTSGGSVRANSVATLLFHGDVDGAIRACQMAYGRERAPCVFTISDVSKPPELDAILARRGYRRGDDHVTMTKPVDNDATLPISVAIGTQPTNGWMEAYLSGLAENRKAIAPVLIAGVTGRAVFVSDDVDGVAMTSGMSVIDGKVASVQCMATHAAARKKGGAKRVLAAIEAVAAQNGCNHLYLQTGGENIAAQRLYETCGYRVIGRYHTRTL